MLPKAKDKYKAILEIYLTRSATSTLTEMLNPTIISSETQVLQENLPVPNLQDTESWKALTKAELNLGDCKKIGLASHSNSSSPLSMWISS